MHSSTTDEPLEPRKGTCPMCSYKMLFGFTAVSSLAFLLSGFIFLAPYWMYDGLSFLAITVIGVLAWREHDGLMEKTSGVDKALVTCVVSAVSIVLELGFLVAAIILWDRVMNPWYWNAYGKKGNSFVFCSTWSIILNSFVITNVRPMIGATPKPVATPI